MRSEVGVAGEGRVVVFHSWGYLHNAIKKYKFRLEVLCCLYFASWNVISSS